MTLKPMSVGEILDTAFTLYKEQFKSYLSIVVIIMAVNMAFGIFALVAQRHLGNAAAGIAFLATLIAMIAIGLAAGGGLVKKASEQISDHEISGMEALRFGFRKTWYIFLGGLLCMIIVSLASILLVIPGIYLGNLYFLFTQVIIVEGKGPWSALKRSKELIKGSWWRSFGIILLTYLLVAVISWAAAFVISLIVLGLFGTGLTGQIIDLILRTPVSCLLVPISTIATTLLYYDLRIRKENLDLKLMVDNLSNTSGSTLSDQ